MNRDTEGFLILLTSRFGFPLLIRVRVLVAFWQDCDDWSESSSGILLLSSLCTNHRVPNTGCRG